jgi:hypothetical protein
VDEKYWRKLGLWFAVAATLLLVAGVVGYLAGLSVGTGGRTGINLVPALVFAAAGLYLLAFFSLLIHEPDFLRYALGVRAILVLILVGLSYTTIYVWQIAPMVAVRADILNWSESPFVDHIIRLRAGEPQFTPIEDGNAFAYPPLAALLTYALASLVGMATSIPAMRVIQQLYLLLGVVFVADAARLLLRMCRPNTRLAWWWFFAWIPFLFLVANHRDVNPFVISLHTDALAVTLHTMAFWVLVRHAVSGNDRWFIAMAILPSAAFLAKQNGLAWAGLFPLYLVLQERPRFGRAIRLGAAAAGVWGLTLAVCYFLMGEGFFPWTFQTLGRLHISFSKVALDLRETGWYLAMGIFGGAVLMRGQQFRRILPIWASWVFLALAFFYTMGAVHRTAHIGPACVMAAGWFLAAVASLWPEAEANSEAGRSQAGLQACAILAILVCMYQAMDFTRSGGASRGGVEKYISEIEQEFADGPADRVLLDVGSWVYLRGNISIKDRASPLGVLGGTRVSDSQATIQRIRARYYRRILVRRVDTLGYGTRFIYPEAIGTAIQQSYRTVRTIPSAGARQWFFAPLLADVDVMEPMPSTENTPSTK